MGLPLVWKDSMLTTSNCFGAYDQESSLAENSTSQAPFPRMGPSLMFHFRQNCLEPENYYISGHDYENNKGYVIVIFIFHPYTLKTFNPKKVKLKKSVHRCERPVRYWGKAVYDNCHHKTPPKIRRIKFTSLSLA